MNATARTTFSTPTMDITLIPNTEWRDRNKHTRIFISNVPDPTGLVQPRYSNKGDDLALDAAWRAYNRAELELRKPYVALALQIVAEVDPAAATAKAHFSRRAGCTCQCSPGFVTNVALREGANGSTPRGWEKSFDIYITVKTPVAIVTPSTYVDAFAV